MAHAKVVFHRITSTSGQVVGVSGRASVSVTDVSTNSSGSCKRAVQQTVLIKTTSRSHPPSAQR